MNKKRTNVIRYLIILISMATLFFVAIVMNVNTGSVDVSPTRIFQVIFFGDNQNQTEYDIIWKIRLPRIIISAVLGGALATAGYLLQTFFRNPIAGPFVLGISSGAKMFVGFVMLIMIKFTSNMPLWLMIGSAFVGSLVSMGFVLIFAKKVNNMSMLLVVGIMIGYICSAVTDFFVTFAEENDIVNLTHWSMGSFSSSNWDMVAVSCWIIIPTFLITFAFSKPIGAYLLGESYAQSMGVDIKVFRVILIALSSVLSATVTAFAGPISFVGIAVPLITKALFGTAKPLVIIPSTFFMGSIFCMYCDLIARTAFSPIELNLGTVTAALGAPIVIWKMVSKKQKSLN